MQANECMKGARFRIFIDLFVGGMSGMNIRPIVGPW